MRAKPTGFPERAARFNRTALIVGRVDPKADRTAGKLRVVSRRVRRGHRVVAAVKALAACVGLQA